MIIKIRKQTLRLQNVYSVTKTCLTHNYEDLSIQSNTGHNISNVQDFGHMKKPTKNSTPIIIQNWFR